MAVTNSDVVHYKLIVRFYITVHRFKIYLRISFSTAYD
jgi:hypothetical protein